MGGEKQLFEAPFLSEGIEAQRQGGSGLKLAHSLPMGVTLTPEGKNLVPGVGGGVVKTPRCFTTLQRATTC